MRSALAALALMLASPAQAQAPAQVLPDGDCAGVYWDLTAAFASGDRVYLRVLVTRAGPGERSAAGVGYWIEPDGKQTRFQNGRGEGDFELADTGERVRIGSTRLELGGAAPAFEVDNDRRGVKLRLAFGAALPASPTPVFSGDPEVALLALGRPTRARGWHTGMTAPRELAGFATIVRTRHVACESDRSSQRFDVHGLAGSRPWLLVHERLADGGQRSWLGWLDARGALRARRPDAVALEDWHSDAAGTRVPQRLRLRGDGLRGSIAIDATQLSIDPLDALPRLVRMLYWFGAHPRRIWADAASELAADGPDALPRGAAIASFSFLRPPDDPNPARSSDSGG